MKVLKVKISEIKTNPKNPRLIKDDKFKKLVKSIKEFPQMLELRPIVVDENNIVLGGNMRLKACLEVGLKEVFIVKADDLTEQQKDEFIVKDNVGFGEWDWDILANEWDTEKLTDWGLDLPLDLSVEELEAEEDDFNVPEGGIETDIVLGDLFEIGEHRLLCGDSTDSDQVAKLMNGQKADMVFTSPPYNQGNGGMKYDYNGDLKKLYQHKEDKKTTIEYFDFCINIFKVISLNIKENGSVFWNVAYNANARDDYGKIVFSELNPFSVKETIIWDKTHAFPTASKGILSRRCELVFLMSKEKYFTNQGENEPINNMWVISSNGSQHEIHKACYPVGLPTEGINLCSLVNEIIYEPFTGSGTTMVASHQLKRKCYGMELDPKYCQVIIDRMKKLDPSLEIKRNGEIIRNK